MSRRRYVRRCTECRRPIAAGEPVHAAKVPAGHSMTLAHREVTAEWHAACWQLVVEQEQASRARSEQARLATLRAICEEAGISPERASAIARSMGAPDPYAPEHTDTEEA